MKGLVIGAGLAGLFYALSRARSSTTPLVQHAPGPDVSQASTIAPTPASAPTPAPLRPQTASVGAAPVVVMAGFNVGWPENMVATLGYMEQNVPPAVLPVIAQLNTMGRGTFSSPRVLIREAPYGYLATILVAWTGPAPLDTAWLANAVTNIIRARGGQVASHLRSVTATA